MGNALLTRRVILERRVPNRCTESPELELELISSSKTGLETVDQAVN